MCGICGIIRFNGDSRVTEPELEAMCSKIKHRGPDDHGYFIQDFVGIGMRRLSIIDLSTGHQPVHNEDKTIWTVYNGETYNFKNLRQDLLSRGHTFYTETDTEVIVHLYEEYGERSIEHLRGMFALAIWDQNRGKILLARDRLGKKPLYYYFREGQILVFASELKSILACSDYRSEIDMDGLAHFLQFGYIPDPLSIFRGIRKLPPGHLLAVTDGKSIIRKYWDVDFTPEDRKSEPELCEELLEKLRESVKLRLVSDVPLGAFLSGGIDSSTIVALMASEMDQPVKTFSIGFEEAEYNELPYARMVADHFSTEHHEMIVRPESFDLIEKIVQHFDEPFGDASAIPTYYVSKLASEHVKVVLSGDGGDELFAGYDSYAVMMSRNKYEGLPTWARSGLKGLSDILPSGFYGKNFLYNVSQPSDRRFIDYVSHISSQRHLQLLSGDIRKRYDASNNLLEKAFTAAACFDPLSRMQYVDMKSYLPGDILVKVDRMSMAHSLEARAPLLDHEFVEYVNALPARYKMSGLTRKYLFKKVAERLLPKEITEKKKQGFAVPLKYWFKGALSDYLRQTLFERRTLERGYFNEGYLRKLVSEYERGRRDHSTLLWHLLVLEVWHRLYMDK